MSEVDLSSPRRVRIGVFVTVGLLHLAAVLALIRAFAPDFTAQTLERVVATFTVTVTAPPPEPVPSPAPQPRVAAGQAGAAGRKAIPREVAAPRPRVAVRRPQTAPPVAATGSANTSGARDVGAGTGAGPAGTGPGGGMGSGQGGGGAATKPVKIAGEINTARDYPRQSRELRLGDYVIVWITVGTDGKPAGCKVVRPSRDAAADAITCRLAVARFRFRPATDSAGQPVVATYGWRQWWFSKD